MPLKLLIPIGFSLLCLGNPGVEGAEGPEKREWALLGESNHFRFYYDDEALTRTPRGVITIWVRLMPMTDDGKENYLKDRKEAGLTLEGYDTFVFDQKLIKLDCLHQTFRIVQRMDFGMKQRVLGFHNFSSPWQDIPGHSAAQALFNELCPQSPQ